MTNPADEFGSHDDRVSRAFAAYNQAIENAVAKAHSDFLMRHAELAHELSAMIEMQDDLHRLAASESSPPGAESRFEQLEPLGRGGLGVVWLAKDVELDRKVAQKLIRRDLASDRSSCDRFRLEAKITSLLVHRGIVPIYSLNNDAEDNRPFYAMRFLGKTSLNDTIAELHASRSERRDRQESQPDLRGVLARFIDVCVTIEYAHSRGVLHCDLKPDNIMVEKYGETIVVDWGLARLVKAPDEPEVTDFASLILSAEALWTADQKSGRGTPQFMSPEQADGRLTDIHRHSDIFALGAILYNILSGRPPYDEADRGLARQRATKCEFPHPRSVRRGGKRPTVPRALEEICLKAMSKEPRNRYASAKALATDIQHWLDDEAVSAYPDSPADYVARWLRKHQRLAAAIVAVALIAVVTLGYFNGELRRQRNRAEKREAVAIESASKFRDVVVEDEQLRNDQRLKPLRTKLLKEPLKFFDELAKLLESDRDTRPESQAKLALAYNELGWTMDQISNREDALKALHAASLIWQRLANAHPTVSEYRHRLARCYNEIGVVLNEMAKPAEATKYFQLAEPLFAAPAFLEGFARRMMRRPLAQ